MTVAETEQKLRKVKGFGEHESYALFFKKQPYCHFVFFSSLRLFSPSLVLLEEMGSKKIITTAMSVTNTKLNQETAYPSQSDNFVT
jgi:hypothetical protein